MPILLVEDDQDLAAGLKQALQNEGFAVNHVATGTAALAAIKTDAPEIIILDIGLPDIDGLTVLKRLRGTHPELPVLLLTARTSLDDKVAGLDSGADDYLPKPFDMEELLARLRVLQRRLGTVKSSSISIGTIILDTTSHDVRVDDNAIELSRREYMLLKALMENAGRVQTREALETKLYSWGEEVASNAVEVHIHNLRKKITPDFIKTIRGVGYVVGRA
ncbi:MAG: response regulator [Gammaproteobacteria bacterium]|nr:response regulator [Gammaproteobacteria bacterium]